MSTKTTAQHKGGGTDVASVKKAVEIKIPPINTREVVIRVEELSPLIMNKFSEKAKQMIADKQQHKAKGVRPAKDPQELFENSLYVVAGREDWAIEQQGRYYLPGVCFKKCAVDACRVLGRKEMPMTKARVGFFVVGDPILEFETISMREDMVRNATGVADIRYRGQFDGWACELLVSYNSDAFSLDQIIELFVHGGYSNGVGDYRPSAPKGGEYGRFRVASAVTQ